MHIFDETERKYRINSGIRDFDNPFVLCVPLNFNPHRTFSISDATLIDCIFKIRIVLQFSVCTYYSHYIESFALWWPRSGYICIYVWR